MEQEENLLKYEKMLRKYKFGNDDRNNYVHSEMGNLLKKKNFDDNKEEDFHSMIKEINCSSSKKRSDVDCEIKESSISWLNNYFKR